MSGINGNDWGAYSGPSQPSRSYGSYDQHTHTEEAEQFREAELEGDDGGASAGPSHQLVLQPDGSYQRQEVAGNLRETDAEGDGGSLHRASSLDGGSLRQIGSLPAYSPAVQAPRDTPAVRASRAPEAPPPSIRFDEVNATFAALGANPGPVGIHAAQEYRHPQAAPDTVRHAFRQDMDARRVAYHANVARLILPSSLRTDSPLDTAINHALASTRGHANAGLVADVIGTDDEVRRRLGQRPGDRSGRLHVEILQDRLDAHRQTMPRTT